MKLLILFCSLWVVALSQHHSSTQYQNPAQSTYGVKTSGQQASGHGYNAQSTHPDGTRSSHYTYQTVDAGTGAQAEAAATGPQAVDQQQTQAAADAQYAAEPQPEVPAAEAPVADAAAAETQPAAAPEYNVQQQTQTVEQQSASNYPTTYTSGGGQTSSTTNVHTPLTYQIVAGGSSGGHGFSFGSQSGSTGTQFGFPAQKPLCGSGTTGSGVTGCGTRTSQTSSTTHFKIPTFQYIPAKTGATQTTTHTQAQYPTVFQELPSVVAGGSSSGSGSSHTTTQVQYPSFQYVPSKTESTQTTTNTKVQYPTLAQDFPQLFSGGAAAAATGSGSSQTTGTIHAQYPTFQYVPAKPATSQTTTHTQAQYPAVVQDIPSVVVSGGGAGSGSSQTTTTQTQYPSTFQYVPAKPATSQTTTHTQAQFPTIVVTGGGGSGSGQTTTTQTQYPGTFQYAPAKPSTSQTTTHTQAQYPTVVVSGSGVGSTTTQNQYPSTFQYVPAKPATSQTTTHTQAQYPAVVYDRPLVVPGGAAGSQTTTTTQTQYPGTFQVVSGGGGSGSASGQTQFVVVSGGGSGSSGSVVGSQQRPTYVVYPGGSASQGFYPGGRPLYFHSSQGGSVSGGSYYPHYYYPQSQNPHSHYFLSNNYFVRPVAGGVHQHGVVAGGAASVTPAPAATTAQPSVQSAVLGQVGPSVPTRGRPTVQLQPVRPYVSHGHQYVSSGPSTTILTRPVSYQQPTQYYQHPHNHHYQYQFPGQNVVSYVDTYPAATSSQTLGQVSGGPNSTPFRASHEKGSTYTSYSALRPSSAQAYSYSGAPSARYAYRVL